MNDGICLNLGGGTTEINGFKTIDRMFGQEVFPLDYEDGTVDEIYASHVLEHFSHSKVSEVVCHWAAKLKPGGRIRIAVPNFRWISEHYQQNDPVNIQGYLMGAHSDENDYHKVIFDEDSLTELMAHAGIERIRRFKSFVQDCSALPVSLNLEGYKPVADDKVCAGVMACVSAPRFGPMMHFRDSMIAFHKARIPYQIGQGAYWQQALTNMMEGIVEKGAEYVLTVDYDTLFCHQDVVELYRLMRTYPEYDAIAPVQMSRGRHYVLFGMAGPDGKPRGIAKSCEFDRNVTQVNTAHFGLTIIRCSSLAKLPTPWFQATPDKNGQWHDGHIDADIGFWHKWREAGYKVGVANNVVVGHLEMMAKWPGIDHEPVYQEMQDYADYGVPPEVMR